MKKLQVGKSGIAGKGVFLAEDVKKGEKIEYVQGERVVKKIKNKKDAQSIPTWYGVGKTIWINPQNTIFRYLNHSCDPNAAIVGTKTVVARRNIKAGEEMTIDYSMTDVDELWEMPCSCGAKKCRKTIKSIQSLPIQVIRGHYPLIPKFFLNTYKRANPSVTI